MMQNIKDSFYMELRSRLALLDPLRTVWIAGTQRPAMVVEENEFPDSTEPQPDAFYVAWQEVHASGPEALLQLSCEIKYHTEGSASLSYQDRCRSLAQLDDELLAICRPGSAALQDFTQLPVADLSQRVFWTRPELGAVELVGRALSRTAKLRVFSFAEAA